MADWDIFDKVAETPQDWSIFDTLSTETYLPEKERGAPISQADGADKDVLAYREAMERGAPAPEYQERRVDVAPSGAPIVTSQQVADVGRTIPGEFVGVAGMNLRGLGALNESLATLATQGVDVVLPDSVMKTLKKPLPWYVNPTEILRQPGKQIGKLSETIKPPVERQNLATDIVGGVGQMAGQTALYLMNPALGIVNLAAMGADIGEQRAEAAGATPEQKATTVLTFAGITTLTEKTGLDLILNRVPPAIKNNVLRTLADVSIAGGLEAAQEVIEGILHNLVAYAQDYPDAEIFEGIEREAKAAGGTGVLFRTLLTAVTGAKGRVRTSERAQKVEPSFAIFDQLEQEAIDAAEVIEPGREVREAGIQPKEGEAEGIERVEPAPEARRAEVAEGVDVPHGTIDATKALAAKFEALMPQEKIIPEEAQKIADELGVSTEGEGEAGLYNFTIQEGELKGRSFSGRNLADAKKRLGEITTVKKIKDGIVPEWETQDTYVRDTPYRKQLDEIATRKEYTSSDMKAIRQSQRWEMKQVLKDKPAYLQEVLSSVEVTRFAKKHDLAFGSDADNNIVIGKTQADVDRVLNAKNQRELGLALGYKDLRTKMRAEIEKVEAPKEAKELWRMAASSKEYAEMPIADLDRAAFGFVAKEVKTLKPDQLNIKWQDDYDAVQEEVAASGLSSKEWAKTIDLSEPIDVIYEDGQFKVDDGYHRWFAAKTLNKPLNVTVEIKDKPHRAIVEKALAEGKPVPPEVLKPYPDLQPKIDVSKKKPKKAPKKRKKAPKTLADFIRSRAVGGIAVDKEYMKGEVRDFFSKKGGFPLINKNGLTLDEITTRVYEAGYFSSRPTVNELLDALREDVDFKLQGTGKAWYSSADVDVAVDKRLDEMVDEYYAEEKERVTAKEYAKEDALKPEPLAENGFTVKEVLAELGKKVDVEIGDVSPIKPLKGDKGAVGLDISKKPKAKKVTYKFSDSAVEARFEAAKGVTKDPISTRVREIFTDLKHKATREYEHLPRGKEFAQLRFDLLKLSKQRGVAGDKTLRSLQGVTIRLDKADFDLFRRKVILDDLTEVAEKGKDLPFGFTPESLSKEKSALDAEVAKYLEIGKSIEARTRLWDAVKNDYTEAMKTIGFDVEKRLQNKNYFRHQVLEYANLRATYGTGKKLKTPRGRGFLRKREGSTLDINTDYIQAEYEVMAQMLYDLEVARTIAGVDEKYNIAEKVKAEAKKENIEDWRDAIPEGYTTWQPIEGNVFYMADSISAKLAEGLQTGALESLGLTKDDVKTVLARGGKFREFIVKEEIADTLDNLTKGPERNIIAAVDKKILRTWKVWTLISPRRWFKYNFRNVTGDADAAFVGNARAFLKVPRAAKELYDTIVGDKAMTPDLVDWFERGGIESTLQAQELGELNKLKMFMRLQETKGKVRQVPLKIWQNYWKAARTTTDMREALLRYAAYLEFLEQMRKSETGKPKDFGASVPEEVMGLSDIKDRAYWLSNDLLGAYDRVSVAGHAMREHIYPFWSWKEVNFKRYMQFWRNAWNDKKTAELVGRKALKGVVKSPYTAYRIGKFLLKATALWSMLQVWNHTMFPDEEDELSAEQKHRPHIILGRDKNGKIINFTRLGALGDFLEWFGLDAPVEHIDNWFKGKRTLREIAVEMAKSPANVLGQGVTPIIKVPVELLTRRSLFPDIFRPGTVRDRGYHFARSLGLENEYKVVASLPSEGYQKSLTKLFIYTSDPLQSAYYDIQSEKARFEAKIGKSREGFTLTPRGSALYNFKLAMRYGDKKAAQKALQDYVLLGGTDRGIVQSYKMMAPLAGLSKKEQKKFVTSLNNKDKEKLQKANKFYKTVLLANPNK